MTRPTLTATVTGADGAEREITVRGRAAWALARLVEAGLGGCTPMHSPAPRWSAYVHQLRRDFGLSVETVEERHGGPFAGWHGRYILRDRVQVLASFNI